MARLNPLKILRTTRANLNAQAGASNLLLGEPYLVTDENRLAIGTSTTTSVNVAMSSDFGTAASYGIGTSGNTVPLLSGGNSWSANQAFTAGASITGNLSFTSTGLGVGNVNHGFFGDGANIAMRAPSGGSAFLQGYGGSTWAYINGGGFTINVPASISGYASLTGGAVVYNGLTINGGASVSGGALTANSGIYAPPPADGVSPAIDVGQVNSGTTGGLRLRGNNATGVAYHQITNWNCTAQWGYWGYNAGGGAVWSGQLTGNTLNIAGNGALYWNYDGGRYLYNDGTYFVSSNAMQINQRASGTVHLRFADGGGYGAIQFGTSTTASQNTHLISNGSGGIEFYQGNWGAGTFRGRVDNDGGYQLGGNTLRFGNGQYIYNDGNLHLAGGQPVWLHHSTFYFNANGNNYISNDGNVFTSSQKLNLVCDQWHQTWDGVARTYYASNGRTYHHSGDGTHEFRKADQTAGFIIGGSGETYFKSGVNHQDIDGNYRFRFDYGATSNYGAPNGYHYFGDSSGNLKFTINGDASCSIKGTRLYFDGSGGGQSIYSTSGYFHIGGGHLTVDGAYVFASYFNQSSGANENPSVSQVIVDNGDGYHRKAGLGYFTDQAASAMCGRTGNIWQFTHNGNNTADGAQAALVAYNSANDGKAAYMSFHRGGAYATNFGLDGDNVMRIGGWSAAANRWQLDMSGNETIAGRLSAASDERIKTDMVEVRDGRRIIRQLKPIRYTRTDQEIGLMRIGFGAQTTRRSVPEAILEDATGQLSIDYGNMVAPVTAAVKSIDREVVIHRVIMAGMALGMIALAVFK